MSGSLIATDTDLEAIVGKTPAPMKLKVIDHLDAGARGWIGRSPLLFAGFADRATVAVTLAGGPPGFAPTTPGELRLPLGSLDHPDLARPGAGFGSLSVLPGIGETLRINGIVAAVEDGVARIAVDECYGHCAKALIRSSFWSAEPAGAVPADPAAFVAACRFLALATVGARGHADLSPRGDPAGAMARLDGDVLWFADRPGNRRVDSFRNIVACPVVALTLLIPGSTRVATVRGRASLVTDAEARERFVVQGKVPQLAVRVEIDAFEQAESGALGRATLWPAGTTRDIDPAKLFVDHLKLNRGGGVGGALTRAGIALPGCTGLLKKGLAKDYRDNLY